MSDERVAHPGHEFPAGGVAVLPDAGGASRATASLGEVLRALRPIVGDAAVQSAGQALALERMARPVDPPSVSHAEPLEAGGARAVERSAETVIAAFLDGIQRSRVVGHVAGVPLVLGTVAAVIRQREQRVLRSWGTPRVHRSLFASRAQLGETWWQRLQATELPLVDITEGQPAASLSPHPLAQRARALDVVALEREQAERQLAAAWCDAERRWLWIDGGIAGNLAVDERATAFGVVKSHNTLYGDMDAVRDVLALRAGERSPAFLVGHRPRRAVASWYLRLRSAPNGDPLHGLVRVEVAPPSALSGATGAMRETGGAAASAFTARVDELSSWILAEGAPLALPDPRWDTLTYGVYACEQYLKSIV